jgi:transmembrane sensor
MEAMDKLLVKHMQGEAKLAEMQAIDQWIIASEHNLKYFTHFKLIWDISKLLKIESGIDTEKAWQEFKQWQKVYLQLLSILYPQF